MDFTAVNRRGRCGWCRGLGVPRRWAVELMVAPALEAAAQAFPGTPEYWRTLDPKAAALLVEFAAADDAALDQSRSRSTRAGPGSNLLSSSGFHT